MRFFSKIMNSFFIALLFFVVIFIGEVIFPGTLLATSFSTLGLMVIFLAIGLDAFFNLSSLD